MEHPQIKRQEWRFATLCSLVISLLTQLPYLIGMIITKSGETFLGAPIVNELDYLSYLAWIKQGASGISLFYDYSATTLFSSAGTLFHPIFLALGTLVRLLCVSPMVIYHTASGVAAFLLMLTLYRMYAWIWNDRVTRMVALIVTALATGIGALLFLPPTEFNFPEYSLFVRMSESLLGSVDTILTLTIFLVAFESTRKRFWRDVFLVGALLGLLVLVHPYMVPVTLITLVLTATLIKRRVHEYQGLRLVAYATCIMLPFALFQVSALAQDPSFSMWFFSGMRTARFTIIEMLLGYGLLIPLSCYGLTLIRRERHLSTGMLFFLSWTVIMILFLVLPLETGASRRFSEMLYIPLSVFASIPLVQLWKNAHTKILAGMIFAMLASGNALYYGMSIDAFVFREWNPQILDINETRVLEWLETRTFSDTNILAGAKMSRAVPIFTKGRVYFGHPALTPGIAEKVQQIPALFDQNAVSTTRAWTTIGEDVDFVIEDEEVRGFGFHGDTNPCMAPVFNSGDIRVFRLLLPCVHS